MKRIVLSIVFCILVFSVTLAAQSKRTVIKAGRMFDARAGKLVTGVTIVVEGDHIVSVGTDAVAPRDGDTVIDLGNATVLPGLMDAHTHLTGDPNFGYQELGVSIPREALIGAKNARITLMAGFTSVRNVGANGFTDTALR